VWEVVVVVEEGSQGLQAPRVAAAEVVPDPESGDSLFLLFSFRIYYTFKSGKGDEAILVQLRALRDQVCCHGSVYSPTSRSITFS
jgi:hypothetical protein